MTILRLTVCGILLFSGLLWLPLAGWSQGKKWTDKECRVRMEQLFKYAKDPSVDLGEVTDNLSIRAGTEFSMYCGIREAKSIKILERQLGDLVAEREQTDESEWRLDKAGKHAENFKSQSSPYDPSGLRFGGN